MAEPVTHAGLFLTASGIASAVVGFIFDVPGSTVFAAAAGAFFAARLGDTVGYGKTFGLISGGTFAGAMLTSSLIHFAGDYPQRGVAFALAFSLIYFRTEILGAVKRTIEGFRT